MHYTPETRQLDAEVAAKVMKLTVVAQAWPCIYDPDKSFQLTASTYEDDVRADEYHPVYCPEWGRWPPVEPESYTIVQIVPFYSTDMHAAWAVVEYLVAAGCAPGLLNNDFGYWALALDGTANLPMQEDIRDDGTAVYDCEVGYFTERGMWYTTATEAICRAALAFVA